MSCEVTTQYKVTTWGGLSDDHAETNDLCQCRYTKSHKGWIQSQILQPFTCNGHMHASPFGQNFFKWDINQYYMLYIHSIWINKNHVPNGGTLKSAITSFYGVPKVSFQIPSITPKKNWICRFMIDFEPCIVLLKEKYMYIPQEKFYAVCKFL